MIIKLISLCFLFSSLSSAEPTRQELSQCEKQAHNFGDGRGRDYIPIECYDYFLKLVSPQAIKKSVDGKIVVYGYRNIVFIKDPSYKSKGQNVIAGSYTELNDILALALDEINKEIVVLEKSGAVLFFSSVVTGNVAPLRILKNKDLLGASDIVVNAKKQEVIILNKNDHEIHFYSRLANDQGREGKKNNSLLFRLENIHIDFLSVDELHQELFMVSSMSDSILVYSLNSKLPVRKITIPGNVKAIGRIEYLASSDEVKIVRGSVELKIPRQ